MSRRARLALSVLVALSAWASPLSGVTRAQEADPDGGQCVSQGQYEGQPCAFGNGTFTITSVRVEGAATADPGQARITVTVDYYASETAAPERVAECSGRSEGLSPTASCQAARSVELRGGFLVCASSGVKDVTGTCTWTVRPAVVCDAGPSVTGTASCDLAPAGRPWRAVAVGGQALHAPYGGPEAHVSLYPVRPDGSLGPAVLECSATGEFDGAPSASCDRATVWSGEGTLRCVVRGRLAVRASCAAEY